MEMSGSSVGVSGFLADIAGDIGNSYNDVLLQDSPLRSVHGEVELLDGYALGGDDAPEALGTVGLDGDILGPETQTVEGFEALDVGPIEGDYTELEEPKALRGPDDHTPGLEGPENDGPDMDEPY